MTLVCRMDRLLRQLRFRPLLVAAATTCRGERAVAWPPIMPSSVVLGWQRQGIDLISFRSILLLTPSFRYLLFFGVFFLDISNLLSLIEVDAVERLVLGYNTIALSRALVFQGNSLIDFQIFYVYGIVPYTLSPNHHWICMYIICIYFNHVVSKIYGHTSK